MFKKLGCILLISILFINCKTEEKQILTEANYADIINQEFTGALAYETTAFVEKYWRVVGNTGFNKSIYKIEEQLIKAGYILKENATEKDVLTYRIEKRALKKPTWESVDAFITINN